MDDTKKPLQEIAHQHGKSLVSLLCGVRSATVEAPEIDEFLENLECFHFPLKPSFEGSEDSSGLVHFDYGKHARLFRHSLNALDENCADYVALSYTWAPSRGEDNKSRGFRVQRRNKSDFDRSAVRNTVFKRASAYMDAYDVDFLWIDRHCIPQKVCQGPCQCRDEYQPCHRKRIGLQAMDWVYTMSQHPLALLAWIVSSTRNLRLLADIILGNFVSEGMLAPRKRAESKAALRLLYDITSDAWWERAWTFQESYQGGDRMRLLMSHDAGLEEEKVKLKCLGGVKGEICIKLVDFCNAADQICGAIEKSLDVKHGEEQNLRHVRGRVQHAISPSGVTPKDVEILKEVQSRGIMDPWDRLAIVANCCRFPYRVAIPGPGQRRSLSISLLALCLQNGVILDNSHRSNLSALPVSRMTMIEVLDALVLKSFPSPCESLDQAYSKGHRFVDAQLKTEGILASGHLWELGPIIETRSWKAHHHATGRERKQSRGLTDDPHRQLRWLVGQLQEVDAGCVTELLSEYLASDKFSYRTEREFAEDLMLRMAKEVAAAVGRGTALQVGRPWREPWSESAGAIFVTETDVSSARDYPAFAFTSSWPCDDEATYDTDRHVSLRVDLERHSGIPHLRTHNGIMGLCFFFDYHRDKVIFPWPLALDKLRP